MHRMSRGQLHGTNETRPRQGCGPEVRVLRRISLCLLVFLFPAPSRPSRPKTPKNVFCGIADYRCCTLTSFCMKFLKMAYRSPKTGLGGRGSQEKLASEAYRTIGGIAWNRMSNRAILGHKRSSLWKGSFVENLLIRGQILYTPTPPPLKIPS